MGCEKQGAKNNDPVLCNKQPGLIIESLEYVTNVRWTVCYISTVEMVSLYVYFLNTELSSCGNLGCYCSCKKLKNVNIPYHL